MDTPRPTNAEMAQLVVMLQDAGLVEVFEDDEGHETYRLTGRGAWVGRMLVMGDEADADAVLESLLGGDDAGTSGVTFRCEQVEPRSPHRPTTASAPIEVAPDSARDIHRGASDTGRDQPGS